MDKIILSAEDKLVLQLESLYKSHAYKRYKMPRFEEYDFYLKYKNFLPKANFVTFSDTSGKLLALKPDITLSIVKNAVLNDKLAEKIYYKENVYRSENDNFKEISQIGLEWIANVDEYSYVELVYLAAKSLEIVGRRYVLNLSHIGFVNAIIDCIAPMAKKEILHCIANKSRHELEHIAKTNGVCENKILDLLKIIELFGNPKSVLPMAKTLAIKYSQETALQELEDLCNNISQSLVYENIALDFSIISDTQYYNGIMINGYIDDIPKLVLSGGSYDNLIKHMHNSNSKAIGFAIVLDDILQLGLDETKSKVDVMLIDKDKDPKILHKFVEKFISMGKTVSIGTINQVELAKSCYVVENGLLMEVYIC